MLLKAKALNPRPWSQVYPENHVSVIFQSQDCPLLPAPSDLYHAVRPLTAPGRGHHLQLGIVGQVGKSPLDRQVKHAPLEPAKGHENGAWIGCSWVVDPNTAHRAWQGTHTLRSSRARWPDDTVLAWALWRSPGHLGNCPATRLQAQRTKSPVLRQQPPWAQSPRDVGTQGHRDAGHRKDAQLIPPLPRCPELG